ncbi:MAG TPA: hypothetical protein VGZ01_11185 [Trinickia sp.]|nr:hypothetical protein [Trinickia sp.]
MNDQKNDPDFAVRVEGTTDKLGGSEPLSGIDMAARIESFSACRWRRAGGADRREKLLLSYPN